MDKYVFTLRVSGIETEADYEDRLFEAGCDDALIAIIDGNLELDFTREAKSFEAAVDSAARDIEKAGGRVVNEVPSA